MSGPAERTGSTRFGCYVRRNGAMIVFSSDQHTTIEAARADAERLLTQGEAFVEIYEVETVVTRKLVETVPF